VALATVADVVPLKGLNRAFVRQGIAILRRRTRPGLAALMDVAGLDGPVQPWHLGFLLGPRINAGGRIGDAALGARLLLTEDEIEARSIAAELNRLNQERQEIERQAVLEATAQADHALMNLPDQPVLMAASADWHPGIVGLVAARLKERFRRPAFALALNGEGGATGSGRSVAGVDLGRAVREAVEAGLAVKGGGHAMAAGVTLAGGQSSCLPGFPRRAAGAQVAAAGEGRGAAGRCGVERGRRQSAPAHRDRQGGALRRGQSRAGLRLSRASPGRGCRDRQRRPCPHQAQERRWRDRGRHRLPGGAGAAGTRLAGGARRERPSRRDADAEPLGRP
jgi:hypothetical protein